MKLLTNVIYLQKKLFFCLFMITLPFGSYSMENQNQVQIAKNVELREKLFKLFDVLQDENCIIQIVSSKGSLPDIANFLQEARHSQCCRRDSFFKKCITEGQLAIQSLESYQFKIDPSHKLYYFVNELKMLVMHHMGFFYAANNDFQNALICYLSVVTSTIIDKKNKTVLQRSINKSIKEIEKNNLKILLDPDLCSAINEAIIEPLFQENDESNTVDDK